MASLSSRKEKILQAVIDDYISSAIPVSSSEIRDKHLPALSSATIRNELAALEEMGYLVQPHTSSGRIPTAEAYKLYVNKLMPKRKLTRAELKLIKSYFHNQVGELKDILSKTAKVLTEVTNLTSVAFVKDIKESVIQSIKLVKVSSDEALVIVVTDLGILRDVTVKIEGNYDEEYITEASQFITEVFAGYEIGRAIKDGKIIKETIKDYKNFFKTIMRVLKKYAEEDMLNDIVLEGSSKILEQPEYSNLNKARAMLEVFDAKKQLIPLIKQTDMDLNIKINSDNELSQGIPECAIITASYSIGGKHLGNAGVIGPIRMDYPKVISVLDYIGKTINALPEGEHKQLEAPEGEQTSANTASDDDDDNEQDLDKENVEQDKTDKSAKEE